MGKCAGKIVECDNCGWRREWNEDEEYDPDVACNQLIPLLYVHDLGERLDPGSVVPAGECPLCGAFAYII